MKLYRFLVPSAFAACLGLNLGTPAADPARPSPELRVVRAERWWRITLLELEVYPGGSRVRSAGTFENPNREQTIRYGEGWKAGKPGYRWYTGPVPFLR